MKTCTKCKEEKDFSEFSKNKATKDGLYGWCKSCALKGKKIRRRESKLKAIGYKGGMCLHCETEYPPEAYEFHHTNPNKKEIDPNCVLDRSWKRAIIELDKCILLCRNCHAIEHARLREGEL